MKKPIKELALPIRGVTHKFRLLDDLNYDRTHGEDSNGITNSITWVVDFRASSFSLRIVRHELLHAYINTSFTDTAIVSPIQVEENAAEIFGHFGPEMLKNADLIFKKLNPK